MGRGLPVPGNGEPRLVEQADDAEAMAAEGVEQLHHAFVGAFRFAGECVADQVGQVQVAGDGGVRVSGAVAEDGFGGPGADAWDTQKVLAQLGEGHVWT